MEPFQLVQQTRERRAGQSQFALPAPNNSLIAPTADTYKQQFDSAGQAGIAQDLGSQVTSLFGGEEDDWDDWLWDGPAQCRRPHARSQCSRKCVPTKGRAGPASAG